MNPLKMKFHGHFTKVLKCPFNKATSAYTSALHGKAESEFLEHREPSISEKHPRCSDSSLGSTEANSRSTRGGTPTSQGVGWFCGPGLLSAQAPVVLVDAAHGGEVGDVHHTGCVLPEQLRRGRRPNTRRTLGCIEPKGKAEWPSKSHRIATEHQY